MHSKCKSLLKKNDTLMMKNQPTFMQSNACSAPPCKYEGRKEGGMGEARGKPKQCAVKSRRGNEGKVGRKSPLYDDTLRIVSGFSTFCTIWRSVVSHAHHSLSFSPSAFVTRVPLPAASWLLVGRDNCSPVPTTKSLLGRARQRDSQSYISWLHQNIVTGWEALPTSCLCILSDSGILSC